MLNAPLPSSAAGDQALFHAVSAPLDAMGKAKFFLGEEGKGAHMKLVVNMVGAERKRTLCACLHCRMLCVYSAARRGRFGTWTSYWWSV